MSACNVVVLNGTIVSEPQVRQLRSGLSVAQFDVTTRDDDATRTVPVSWPDPPADHAKLANEGARVVVVGRVNRRFFRAGGATQSRTEVVADRVLSTTRTRQVAKVLAATAADLVR